MLVFMRIIRGILGFAWHFHSVIRYFAFSVLSSGLSSACFCFTKLMRLLVQSDPTTRTDLNEGNLRYLHS